MMRESISGLNSSITNLETDSSMRHLKTIAEGCGLHFDALSQEVKDRLALLKGEWMLDEIEKSMGTMRLFFDELEKSGIVLSSQQRNFTLAAELLSDIGKTGDSYDNSTSAQRKMIFSLYNIKDFFPPETMVADVIRMKSDIFPHADESIAIFDSIPEFPAKSAGTGVRALWGVHVLYTYKILLSDPNIPREVVAIAAQHHFVEGQNPGNILQPDGSYNPVFGTKDHFGYEELIVMLMDKYHAIRFRDEILTHEQAMDALERQLKMRLGEKYQALSELPRLIDIMRAKLPR